MYMHDNGVIVFVDMGKNVSSCLKSLFHKKDFKLEYSNKYCIYLKSNTKKNVWITVGLSNIHNLMTYNKISKIFIYVPYEASSSVSFLSELEIMYTHLQKKCKNICVVTNNQESEVDINFKKKLLVWCIDKTKAGIPFVEINTPLETISLCD